MGKEDGMGDRRHGKGRRHGRQTAWKTDGTGDRRHVEDGIKTDVTEELSGTHGMGGSPTFL